MQLLCLRQAEQTLDVLAAGEVDLRLLGGHGVDIFLERDELRLARVVEQQVLDLVDLVARLGDGAGTQHHAEGGVELLVLLTVVGHELRQLGLDLLAEVRGDELELAVVLEHLTRDVQRQVGRIDHAAGKRIARRQEVGALVHDHDAGAVELETGVGFTGEHVRRSLGRDEQQRAVGDQALGVDADDGQRVVLVVELVLIKRDALLIRRFLAAALPDGDHAVDGLLLGLRDHLHLRLALFVLLAGVDPVALLDVHDDRPADIVGILADEHHELPVFEIGGVLLAGLVFFDVHDDVRADGVLLGLGDGVAVRAGADPLVGRVAAVGASDDRDLVGDHERGIEANAELTDNVDGGVLLRVLAEAVLELQRAAARDDAEVAVELLLRHADAVIRHRDRARVLIRGDADLEIAARHAHVFIRERLVAELVDRVRGVRDDLAQEDLLVRVDRVDHHVEQFFRLGLELFLCHIYASKNFITPSDPHRPACNSGPRYRF